MALDVVATCAAAEESFDTPGLAVFLTVLFSVYIFLDSLIAASVIIRKASEAEDFSKRSIGQGRG